MDSRWEQNVDWNQINPQPDNSDEGFDEEGVVPGIQEMRVLARVELWVTAVDISNDENEALGNEIEAEIDYDFEKKRRSLIEHFLYAYDAGLVKWPRAFSVEKKACYNKGIN